MLKQQIIQKARLERKKICLTFIHLEKAFNKVPRVKLWEILKQIYVEVKMIEIIQNIYSHNINCVISNGGETKEFTTKRGYKPLSGW